MKYISLFAGIGGFDLALNRQGHNCVYVNEWDKHSTQTYEKNFIDKVDTRSITDVPTSEIPNHDILVGGFPCQSFSIAGKRRGFEDTRGTMFYEIARILKDKRPAYLLLENVKGLLSHDNGKTFSTIMWSLDELGYECQWQVLNSKNHGVPQNRERVFIVGHLRGRSRPKIFPFRYDDGISDQTTQSEGTWSQAQLSTTVRVGMGTKADSSFVIKIGTYRTHKDGNGFRENKGGVSPTIPARAREDGSGQPIIVQRTPLKFLQRNQRNIEGDYSFTVDTANTGGIRVGMRIRRLTPIECERLQGFPDNWTAGVSDTQRYKQLGNAVTVNVVEEIVKKLFIE